jgi:hypothetical protein
MLPVLQEPMLLPNSLECFDDSSGVSWKSAMNLSFAYFSLGKHGLNAVKANAR